MTAFDVIGDVHGHADRLRGLLARGHRNVAVVALANKLSRIAWAVLRRGKPFNLSHGATSI